MKFYLSSGTRRAKEMNEYAMELSILGHEVVSRWHQGVIGTPRLELDDPKLEARARDDLEDIDRCDAIIAFSGSKTSRGGRHYELGYARAKRKACFLIGDPEHAFHLLTSQYDLWEKFVEDVRSE
jgi:hypothetical protein